MARTKSSTKAKSRKQKALPVSVKGVDAAQSKAAEEQEVLSCALRKEHEDDVHEALLCVLQTKKISKQQLLEMAKHGGIESHVASTLQRVRGDECAEPAEAEAEAEEDAMTSSPCAPTKHKKLNDFYDPSILASPSASEPCDERLFAEVIDLARGGIGGQFTNAARTEPKGKGKGKERSRKSQSLKETEHSKGKGKGKGKSKKKKKRKKSKRKRKRKRNASPLSAAVGRSSSLTSLPVSCGLKKRRLASPTAKRSRQRPAHSASAYSCLLSLDTATLTPTPTPTEQKGEAETETKTKQKKERPRAKSDETSECTVRRKTRSCSHSPSPSPSPSPIDRPLKTRAKTKTKSESRKAKPSQPVGKAKRSLKHKHKQRRNIRHNSLCSLFM